MYSQRKISIAKEWSKSPTGRYITDGKSNGTDFKNKFIIPFLNSVDKFLIDLDGTDGYGSSFLDEAFAGLVRDRLLSYDDFVKRFEFVSEDDPSFIEEIMSYVDEAKN